MKITIERSLLFKALGHVQSIADRRAVTPVLSNVLLSASGSDLTLTATDLDISIQETIPVMIETEGSITIPAHLAHDIVRKLPDGVEIELTEKPETNQLTIKAGKSKFVLPTLPAKDFSPVKAIELPHTFSLSVDDLSALIHTTRFCMSTEETRYYLNGIYFHIHMKNNDVVLRAVSTDGHRLALADVAEPTGASGMPNVIIPRKTISEIGKLLEDGASSVSISLSHTQIKFNIGRAVLISRLIDGTFPDYDKVIPSGEMHTLEVQGERFIEAVDRVSTISNDKAPGIKMIVEPHKIILSATGLDHATGSEEIEAHYNGKRLTTGFNARYLLDIAHQIKEETIAFHFVDEHSPALIKDVRSDQVLYVLMPMRL